MVSVEFKPQRASCMAVPMDVQEFVSRALTELEGQSHLAVISVPAPAAPPLAFLRLQPRNMRFFWDSPGGATFPGGGVARALRVSGPERYTSLLTQVGRLRPAIPTVVHPDFR